MADELTIPVSEVEQYLVDRLNEWYELGDRKYSPYNVWGYNFIRACMDDLETYKRKAEKNEPKS